VGAVRADHEVEVNLDLPSPLPFTRCCLVLHFEPGFVFPEVSAYELMTEKEGHIRHLFQDVKETFVETAAVDGEDGL
jgi:hypothetical protein